MILQEINRENQSLYFEKLFEDILLDYNLMIMANLLWPLDYVLDDNDTTCSTLHLSIDIALVYIVPWSWFTLYDNVILNPTCDHVSLSHTTSYTCID